MSTEWVVNSANQMAKRKNTSTAALGRDISDAMRNNTAIVKRLAYESNKNGVGATRIAVPK